MEEMVKEREEEVKFTINEHIFCAQHLLQDSITDQYYPLLENRLYWSGKGHCCREVPWVKSFGLSKLMEGPEWLLGLPNWQVHIMVTVNVVALLGGPA